MVRRASTVKHDYDALELEYIQGPDSLTPRAMAIRDGASYSSYYVQSGKREWARKREEYREKQQHRAVRAITDMTAVKAAEIRAVALDVIKAAILKMGLDLQDRVLKDGTVIPGLLVTPSDVAKLIDKVLLLTGNPNAITENRNLGLDLTADLDPDLARLLAEVAGERGTAARGVGRSPLPGGRPTH